MAKRKIRNWMEAELILTFKLNRRIQNPTPLMTAWLNAPPPQFDMVEQANFNALHRKAVVKIAGWSEEDLKMKFISFVLELAHITEGDKFVSFFERIIEAEVDGHWLRVKTDFMVAKGLLNLMQAPYFHIHEYKPQLNPKGEPMAQLLEGMLIAQTINKNDKPIYGCEIIGPICRFVILDGREYCVSESFDCTKHHDLMQIIGILREFKVILETQLLD